MCFFAHYCADLNSLNIYDFATSRTTSLYRFCLTHPLCRQPYSYPADSTSCPCRFCTIFHVLCRFSPVHHTRADFAQTPISMQIPHTCAEFAQYVISVQILHSPPYLRRYLILVRFCPVLHTCADFAQYFISVLILLSPT